MANAIKRGDTGQAHYQNTFNSAYFNNPKVNVITDIKNPNLQVRVTPQEIPTLSIPSRKLFIDKIRNIVKDSVER
jgi:hypothetical protein